MPDRIDYTKQPDNPFWEMALNGYELLKHLEEIIDSAFGGTDQFFCIDCVEGEYGPMRGMPLGALDKLKREGGVNVFQPEPGQNLDGSEEPVCPDCGSGNLRKSEQLGKLDSEGQRISPEMARAAAPDSGPMVELAISRIKGVFDDWVAQGEGIKPVKAHYILVKLRRAAETGSGGGIRFDPGAAMKAVLYNELMTAMDPDLIVYYPNSRFKMSRGIGKPSKKMREDIEILTMGDLLTEDGMGYKNNMTKEVMEFIHYVNSKGFAVCMREDLQGLTGFDEPLQDAEPIDAGMETMDNNGAAEGGGEAPVPDQEGEWSDMPAGGPAMQELLSWAETNGCDPNLCNAVRTELGDADAEAGVPGDEAEIPGEPGDEIEALPGAGPLRNRTSTGL